MSNSCIHHLSKLSINKYLQSDVFLFHSLIAGDINSVFLESFLMYMLSTVHQLHTGIGRILELIIHT